MGAALDMLKKSKKRPDDHDEGQSETTPPSDAKEGSAYSKVGGVVGDDDYEADGGDGTDDADLGDPMPDDDHEDAASFDSLADHLGIPEEKRAGAKSALKTYVKACMREHTSSDK